MRWNAIVLCGITATPPNKEIHKTALGAELTVRWDYEKLTTDALQQLRGEGYTLLAVEQVEKAARLTTFEVGKGKKYALVFGNEVDGVAQEAVDLCDGAVEIPQQGTKHSLNVAVSAAWSCGSSSGRWFCFEIIYTFALAVRETAAAPTGERSAGNPGNNAAARHGNKNRQKPATQHKPCTTMSTDSKTRVVTTYRLAEMKARGEKISMLTAYDYSMARASSKVPAWT